MQWSNAKLAVAVLFGSIGFRALSEPTYYRIERLPGSTSPDPAGISSSGELVVGKIAFNDSTIAGRGFVWSLADGLQLLTALSDSEGTEACGVSEDGRVIVGQSRAMGLDVGVRWTSDGTVEELPVPTGWSGSKAWGVSDSGRVIAGELRGSDGRRLACRWVDDLMPQALTGWETEGRSSAYGISRNGEYITGSLWDETSGERAFIWSESGGLVELGPFGTSGWNVGWRVSNDGQTVAGFTNAMASVWKSDRGWIQMQRQPMDLISWMSGLTAGGRLAVGGHLTGSFGETGVYWRKDTSFVRLEPNVSDPLFDPPGYDTTVFEVFDVSADGTTLVCRDLGGAWLVTGLPRIDSLCMPDFTGDGVLDITDVDEFLTLYSGGRVEADFVLDGRLDFFDLQAFLNAFAEGCGG